MKGVFVSDDGCVVCMEADVEVCLFQCKHACVCQSCSSLLLKRSAPCPMCREIIHHTKLLKDLTDDESPKEVPQLVRDNYLITRSEFIEKFNLKAEKKGKDLVITANNVEKFSIDSDIAHEVFEYYLGTSIYSSHVHVIREVCGASVTLTSEDMQRVESGQCTFEDLLNKPGYDKLTFKGFFVNVTDDIVNSKKLCQHLIDQYFQDYLLFLSTGVKQKHQTSVKPSSHKRSFIAAGTVINFK